MEIFCLKLTKNMLDRLRSIVNNISSDFNWEKLSSFCFKEKCAGTEEFFAAGATRICKNQAKDVIIEKP